MSNSSNTVVIVVAVIGLVGTLGAALITSWDGPDGAPPANTAGAVDPGVATAGGVKDPPAPISTDAPHAPAIHVNSATDVWGEDTRLIGLAPGERATLDARNLYSNSPTFPVSGCAGPAVVIYTWQVRDPYPQGGDLEVLNMIPRAGGRMEQVAMGARGRLEMGPCDEHVLKNNGLQPLRVEVRYATAMEQLPEVAGATSAAADEVDRAVAEGAAAAN